MHCAPAGVYTGRALAFLLLTGATICGCSAESAAAARASAAAGNLTWFTFYDFWLNPAYSKPPFRFNFSQASAFINAPTLELSAAGDGVELQFRAG